MWLVNTPALIPAIYILVMLFIIFSSLTFKTISARKCTEEEMKRLEKV